MDVYRSRQCSNGWRWSHQIGDHGQRHLFRGAFVKWFTVFGGEDGKGAVADQLEYITAMVMDR